jgi:uncharacterized protein YdcH (DUF465 family)
MRLVPLLFGLALIWVVGCSPVSRERLTQEVLRADPSFASVLDKHRELANRVKTYERELALKRSAVEQTVKQLRKELAAVASAVRRKTAETKKRMEPDRKRLELSVSMAGEELHAKRAQRASLGRSITQLKKALNSRNAAWTAQERSGQEAQIQEMLRDAARLDHELAALNEHVRLLRIKLLIIKL